jgi:hypothetical protein
MFRQPKTKNFRSIAAGCDKTIANPASGQTVAANPAVRNDVAQCPERNTPLEISVWPEWFGVTEGYGWALDVLPTGADWGLKHGPVAVRCSCERCGEHNGRLCLYASLWTGELGRQIRTVRSQ